jgi:DNA-binding transcriptional LysR family regulator
MNTLEQVAPKSAVASDAKRHIDLALLRTFSAIAETGSMARAADRVARSQPAVSLQMKKLEETMGGELFRKGDRRMALTERGETLLAYAQRLLELNDEAVAAMSPTSLSGSIRLGIAQDFAEGCLTTVLARLARAHSSLTVEVIADRNTVLLDQLASKQLDIALMLGAEPTAHSVSLLKVPTVWIGSNGTQVNCLPEVPLVLYEAPCAFRRAALESLQAAGMNWRIVFSSPSLSSQWSAVTAGLGISVRTHLGVKAPLKILGSADGLPSLPLIDVSLHLAGDRPAPLVKQVAAILTETMRGEFSSFD